MDLNSILIYERKRKGMTQKELAKELCVSIQTINNWERSKTLSDAVNLTKISKFFDVNFLNSKCKKEESNLKGKNFRNILSLIKRKRRGGN